jgi:hypothetical protein
MSSGNPMSDRNDDRAEHLLRRALDAEAARVEVRPDALVEIRRRVAARRSRRVFRGGVFVLGTGAAVAATVVTVFAGLGSCGPRPSPPAPPVAAPTTGSPAAATTPSPGTAGPTGGPAGPAAARLPVYYLGDDGGRLRLYREFHELPAGDGSVAARTRAAVGEMLGQTAADPDYVSAWPDTARVRDVRIEDGVVTVDLSGAARGGAGSEAAHQAVQQLVYTVSAVVGGNPGVRLLLDGRETDELWGGVGVGGVLRKAPLVDVQALVWLISPQHGQTVDGTFEVHVAGVVHEATVQLRVRQGTRTVQSRFVTLSRGAPGFGDTKTRLTLDPGTYTIEAYETSAADGSELHLDDHEVTVR